MEPSRLRMSERVLGGYECLIGALKVTFGVLLTASFLLVVLSGGSGHGCESTEPNGFFYCFY